MSDKTFPSFLAFRGWIGLAPGETIEFPLGENSNGWKVVVHDDHVETTSSFYRIAPNGKYGAPMIVGHNVHFGGVEVSGVIEFDFFVDGVPKVANRRRITASDTLGTDKVVVATIVAHPDRVLEKVAVVAFMASRQIFRAMTAEKRLGLFNRVRDGVELEAVRVLFKWADATE